MNKELLPIQNAKKAAGQAAVDLIEDGMVVGLGTGSTATYFIEELAKKCKEGLKIKGIASSRQTQHLAESLRIPLIDPDTLTITDIDVDGADEIDLQKNMIKGGGGALLREKILAQASKEMVVVVDETKLVKNIGLFPLAIEILSFGYRSTIERIKERGYRGILRLERDKSIYLTDNKNYIVDIHLDQPITNPKKIEDDLKSIAGVLETGLFFNVAKRVIVGYEDGFVKILT